MRDSQFMIARPMISATCGTTLFPSWRIRAARSSPPGTPSTTRTALALSELQWFPAGLPPEKPSIADVMASLVSDSLSRSRSATMNTRRRGLTPPTSQAAMTCLDTPKPSAARLSCTAASHAALPGGCSTMALEAPDRAMRLRMAGHRVSPVRYPWIAAATLVRWQGGPPATMSASTDCIVLASR